MSQRFELAGSIAIDDVPDVRKFVERVHRRVVPDGDDISRIIMAAHELLENAVKFSADGSATLHIEITNRTQVAITTRNRARPDDLEEVKRVARELDQADDPMAFYLNQMSRSPMSRGGLGIGRVAAEGEMDVEFKLDGDIVEVQARSTVGGSA